MSFNPSAKDSGGMKYELTPEGPTVARCVRVIEIGQQANEKYGTVQNKAVIVFSLPNYTIDLNGEKMQKFISQPFGINMSNNEKSTMAEYVKALNPKAENLGDFLDRPCQIYISHFTKQDKSEGERIDSVSAILPGLEVGQLDTEPFWFQWNDPSPEIYSKIPKFTRELMSKAVNYKGSLVEQIAMQVEESGAADMPF